MPKTKAEVTRVIEEEERAEEEKQRKVMEVNQWIKSMAENVKNQILETLEGNPELVFTPEELLTEIFGEKECALRTASDEDKCSQCESGGGAKPGVDMRSHVPECDYCKHFLLIIGGINGLAEEDKIEVYAGQWVGVKPKESPAQEP